MPAFDDAKALVEHCAKKLPDIAGAYRLALADENVKADLCIEVKSYLEHLRSALDYCASSIYTSFGKGKPSTRPYFPYANLTEDETAFRTTIMKRSLPGVAEAKPEVVDLLTPFQHFGNTGHWLPMFMEMTNENKHREFSPQAKRVYTLVHIEATIPPGETMEINLKSIPIDEKLGYKARAGKYTTYEFVTSGALAMPFLQDVLVHVSEIVNSLSKVA